MDLNKIRTFFVEDGGLCVLDVRTCLRFSSTLNSMWAISLCAVGSCCATSMYALSFRITPPTFVGSTPVDYFNLCMKIHVDWWILFSGTLLLTWKPNSSRNTSCCPAIVPIPPVAHSTYSPPNSTKHTSRLQPRRQKRKKTKFHPHDRSTGPQGPRAAAG